MDRTDPADRLHWGDDGAGPVTERDADGYADLRSHAATGDGRTIALVARDGRIDWLPLPDMDTTPAFGALLDTEQGGCVELCPVEEYTVGRSYVGHTNVLATTVTTASGSVRFTDAMNTGVAGRLPWAELARRVEGPSGSVRMRAAVRPGSCLGTAAPWDHDTVHGPVLRVGGLTLAVRELGADTVEHGDLHVDLGYTTSAGSRHLLALVGTHGEPLFPRRPTPSTPGSTAPPTTGRRAWAASPGTAARRAHRPHLRPLAQPRPWWVEPPGACGKPQLPGRRLTPCRTCRHHRSRTSRSAPRWPRPAAGSPCSHLWSSTGAASG